MSFGMGQRGYPAISMTQHAANKYCQWLSAQTGHFYRLPTEAEWEYACRAGTTTAYSFGDDPAQLGEYAWYYDNSNEKYQKVGQKKPNPWGLHDMHGNVMEWCSDQFAEDYFTRIKDKPENPFLRPEKLYPRSVRGGGWDDDPEQLRSAHRRGSDPYWKVQDPQLPKSIWYHTDAIWLGFRLVRPLEIPTVEEMDFYWNSAAGKTR
jgi:formylglycine-generating enzyme required for sulfatase activity